MLVYLDRCCLKRPFDDQSQLRIHLESEAVLGLLAAEPERIQCVRSLALELENEQNPLPSRAAKVQTWLAGASSASPSAALLARTTELVSLGFGNFDALHVASAEAAGADAQVTCDDQLLSVGRRHGSSLSVRIVSILELAAEVLS